MGKNAITTLVIIPTLMLLSGCILNDPYPSSQRGQNICYGAFPEEPRHLDPAISYSLYEYGFLSQIYEPPLAYHYLKRPYELIPLTAERIPIPAYFDGQGNELPSDAPENIVKRAVYDIRIKPGIMYQNHPCFAKDDDGNFIYHRLRKDDIKGIYEIRQFPKTGTRELVSADYVYQIKRLANPLNHCPILSTLERYILGMKEYADALERDLESEREKRKSAAGSGYNQELDEIQNPIKLDMNSHPFLGVQVVDRYTYRIILKTKYPQIVYWLAMPFFSPMPWEAIVFHDQGILRDRNITIDRCPIGTGPYKIDVYDPHKEITFVRNENFRTEYYPTEGEPDDEENGLLQDAGKPIPFMDKVIYKLEKEYIPCWNKFLQGYYDVSAISSDTFDRAIKFTERGDPDVSQMLQERNIRLLTSTDPAIYYLAFNMLDNIVGGYTEDKCKLRQAISIALDNEESIQIFDNGRAIPAHSPIPPGIFGYEEGKNGMNPYVYNWDNGRNLPVRKSLDEARKLLAEAGYPGGKDKKGRQLILGFDNAWTGSGAIPMINWIRKKLATIGVTIENRTTDANRFGDKMHNGNFQVSALGWYADYPDPENLLFPLYGPSGTVKFGGENVANYDNPEYNRLFERMRSMENTPERMEIIRKMRNILQHDATWVFTEHPVSFTLFHEWIKNVKPMEIGLGNMKYCRIHAVARGQSRREWNQPVIMPVLAFAGILALGTFPAIIIAWRKERGRK